MDKFIVTPEWLKAEYASSYHRVPFKMPAEEFQRFSAFLVTHITHVMRKCVGSPSINASNFLLFLFMALDAEQRQAIRDLDTGDAIARWEKDVACHVAVLEAYSTPGAFGLNWDTARYARIVYGLSPDKVVWLSGDSMKTTLAEIKAMREEYDGL